MVGADDGSTNELNFGGGTSVGYAIKNIYFRTAADDTTVTGTVRLSVNSTGNVGIGLTSASEKLQVSGNIRLTTDSNALQFGTAQDATILYDGTNLVINPKAVGTGYLGVSGNVNVDGLTASKVVFTDASKTLTSTGIGTSAQFIKGDGSLDSTVYGSALDYISNEDEAIFCDGNAVYV